ncbi:uncharacterized protein LOC141629273 [Silene latifolia]|uniref:uncharacterized protein LOC141629273 n=1 Tax=Silene latifolia TaxID=37657 RepID=UPI003D7818F7
MSFYSSLVIAGTSELRKRWEDFVVKLEEAIDLAISEGKDDQYTSINDDLRKFAEAVVVFWRQRAEIRWNIDGDICTKYFFNWVKGRAGRNFIYGTKVENDAWNFDNKEMGTMFYKTFYDLYNPNSLRNGNGTSRENSIFADMIHCLQNTIKIDDGDFLARPFTAKEVRRAVFQMVELKYPGPDGIPADTFIPGRQISNNILLAHETIHNINSHKKGVNGIFAFKADMSKAYDRVRWDFLRATLHGFSSAHSMELRQGYPLSPYLFILCIEVLSANVYKAQHEGLLKGIKFRNSEALTHLFFADDSIFFLHDKNDSVVHLKGILSLYCKALGQVLNETKSGVLLSPSTKLSKARRCLKVLNIKHNKGIGKYLGVSTDFQSSKKCTFKGLADNVIKRISS